MATGSAASASSHIPSTVVWLRACTALPTPTPTVTQTPLPLSTQPQTATLRTIARSRKPSFPRQRVARSSPPIGVPIALSRHPLSYQHLYGQMNHEHGVTIALSRHPLSYSHSGIAALWWLRSYNRSLATSSFLRNARELSLWHNALLQSLSRDILFPTAPTGDCQ